MITVIVQAVTCCKQYHHFKLFQQSFKMKIMELSSGRKQTIRRQWWISRFEISKKEAGGRGSYFQQLLSVSLRSAMSFTMGFGSLLTWQPSFPVLMCLSGNDFLLFQFMVRYQLSQYPNISLDLGFSCLTKITCQPMVEPEIIGFLDNSALL